MIEITKEQSHFFKKEGYLLIKNLLTPEDVCIYQEQYEAFLDNRIDARAYRSDLGSHAETKDEMKGEKITQIMVPSKLLPALLTESLHRSTLNIARQLLGDDMELDFDMMIDKAPFSNTPTPWHQDCAYWIDMPDKRALSCWVSLDQADLDNGCMWYIPGSHLKTMRPHFPAGKGGGALECKASESEAVAVPMSPGDCVVHHGGTAHYSRGNSTANRRRAFITNYRPTNMIAFERDQGYDHTGERKLRGQS